MGSAFKRKRWREAQRLRVDVNGMMAQLIGEGGLSDADLERLRPRLIDVHVALDKRRRAGSSSFAALPRPAVELKRALLLAEQVRGRFDDLVLVGNGGAASAARVLSAALASADVGPGPAPAGAMRVHMAVGADPGRLAALLGGLDLRRTLFNVVSESGDTAATLGQFLIVRDRLLKELGAVEYKQHIVVTTDAARGTLRQVVNDEGFRELAIPPRVKGCLAALSAVGLFPAACAGIDVAEVLAGAAEADARAGSGHPGEDPVLLHAAVLHLAGVERRRLLVLWPYAEALAAIARWFCELWAESVAGAPAVLAGRAAAEDAHPAALPPCGDGAAGVVVFLRVEEHDPELVIPKSYEDLDAVAYLGGLGLGALVNLEQEATELALAKAGRMSSTIVCPRLSPFVAGELIQQLVLEAGVVSALGAATVVAEPAVPEPVQLTAGLAGRPGYESKGAEVQRWAARKEARYVV